MPPRIVHPQYFSAMDFVDGLVEASEQAAFAEVLAKMASAEEGLSPDHVIKVRQFFTFTRLSALARARICKLASGPLSHTSVIAAFNKLSADKPIRDELVRVFDERDYIEQATIMGDTCTKEFTETLELSVNLMRDARKAAKKAEKNAAKAAKKAQEAATEAAEQQAKENADREAAKLAKKANRRLGAIARSSGSSGTVREGIEERVDEARVDEDSADERLRAEIAGANAAARDDKKVVKEESRNAYTPQDVVNTRVTNPQKDEVTAGNQGQLRRAYDDASRLGRQRARDEDVARVAARDRQRLLTSNGVNRLALLAGTVVQESIGDGKKAAQVAKKQQKKAEKKVRKDAANKAATEAHQAYDAR